MQFNCYANKANHFEEKYIYTSFHDEISLNISGRSLLSQTVSGKRLLERTMNVIANNSYYHGQWYYRPAIFLLFLLYIKIVRTRFTCNIY
jgi:hypothetical protein